MPKWGFAQVDQQWYNTPDLLADAERMYSEVKPLAPKYWRIGAAWALIAKQPDPGTLIAGTPPSSTGRDWTTLDTALNEALLLGSEVVLILGVAKPYWGGVRIGPFSWGGVSPSAADFGVWCAEVVRRYKPGGPGIRTDGRYATNGQLNRGVRIFEIWNEENDQNHDGGQINAKDYTDRLVAAYNSIKAVPDLTGTPTPGVSPGVGQSMVIFGGTYHVQRIGSWLGYGIASLPEIDYLTQCYSYGAQGKFDAMAVHVYPHLDTTGYNGSDVGPVPTMNLDNMRQLVEIRQLMVDQGDGAKKIWVTEAGFPCSNVTEAQQSSYWQQLWGLFAALSYVEVVLFYCARDGGTDMKNVESTWGAMRYDFTHKPVWDWLATLSPGLNAGFTSEGTLSASVTIGGAKPAFTGSGTLVAKALQAVTLSLTGSGVLSVTAEKFGEKAPVFTGSGTVSATVSVKIPVAAQLSGEGVVSVTVSQTATAAFTGDGTLSAQAGESAPQFTGEGTFTAAVQQPVVYDSQGTYTSQSGGSNNKTISWDHTITYSDANTWVFVEVVYGRPNGVSTGASTVTYGGVTMTSKAAVDQALPGGSSGSRGVRVFALRNPPTGPQTVSYYQPGVSSLSGNSVAFQNAGSVSSGITGANNSGTTATRILTGATSAGSRISGVSAGAQAVASISGVSRGTVAIQDAPGEADGSTDLAWYQGNVGQWVTAGVVLTAVAPLPSVGASLAGSGTLTATVIANPVVAPTFTGAGTLTAATVPSLPVSAAFTGDGVLTALLQGGALFSSVGTLSAVVSAILRANATHSGTGTLTVVAAQAVTANFTGTGAVTAATGFPYTFPITLA